MDTKRPSIVADERTQLVGWYDTQRAIVHYKCEGVSEADAHRAVLPAESNKIIAAHSLDEPGKNTDYDEGAASLRWMVLHMLEETARHAGHLDAIRELLDGTKGYF